MAKYKLEYLWLDGYEPRRQSSRQNPDQRIQSFSQARRAPLMWALTVARRAKPKVAPRIACSLSSRGLLSRHHPQERRPRHVRSHDAGRQDPAPSNSPAPPSWTIPVRGSVSKQNISSTKWQAPRLPDVGYPYPQGLYYTGVGYDAVGNIAVRSLRASRPLHHWTPASITKVSMPKSPKASGIQIFGKGSQERCRPDVGRPLPPSCVCAKIRRGCELALQTPRQRRDWNGSGCTPTSPPPLCVKVGGKGNTSKLSWQSVRQIQERTHRRVWAGQSPPPHRPARNAVH